MTPATATQQSAPVPVTRGLKSQKNASFLSQSNTSVRKPIVAQKLHWIEGTFPERVRPDLPPILSQKFVETRPLNGYLVGSLYEDGRRMDVHPSRPDMGTHFTWSGTACDDCPIEPEKLIEYLVNARFKFTRLDLAVDVINHKLRPQRATKDLKLGKCKTSAQLSPRYDDPRDKGYTQYIGKKTSQIYLKLYDKAEEMGIIGDHTRIELTVRQGRANRAAREVVQGTDYRRLVVAFADFPQWRQWNKAMAANPVKLPKEQTIGNTEKWLLDSCAPALARVIFFNSEAGFFEKFTDEVTRRLADLQTASKGS